MGKTNKYKIRRLIRIKMAIFKIPYRDGKDK